MALQKFIWGIQKRKGTIGYQISSRAGFDRRFLAVSRKSFAKPARTRVVSSPSALRTLCSSRGTRPRNCPLQRTRSSSKREYAKAGLPRLKELAWETRDRLWLQNLKSKIP